MPREAVDTIRERAVAPTPERVAEIEARTHHDVAAFVDAVAEGLGEEGRWFHYGLTSSDVLDTAPRASDPRGRRADPRRARPSVRRRRRDAPRSIARRLTIGRTHGVHAEPTTFGLKLAGWAFALERDRDRVARALEGMRVGKLSGAVGTYSAAEPEVERVACERLGLEPAPSSTQILQRDRHAEVLNALALLATSLERFALEIRHLARTEVREVEEPFGSGQKGSSAMPHKRNPIISERICGLARVVRAAAVVGLENVALWHERDISHSSAERIVLPDAFLAVDYMLDRFAWLMEGLVVRAERMRENVDASHRLYFSQRLLLALVEAGLSRDDAYRLVQRHAMRAWDEGLDFPELVRADAEIAGRVDLDAVFDLGAYTRHVEVVFDRLRALQPGAASMPEAAVHLGSGKVRELYALDDERLLLVASDRISAFDVVLPTEVPDKGRVLTGLSAFWFARTQGHRPESPARAPRRRPITRMPAPRDAAGRDRRPRLPVGLGLEGLREDRCGLRPSTAARSARVRPPARADRHARDEGPVRPRREHRRARCGRARRRRALGRGRARRARALPLRRRHTPRRAGSSSPTRSSSSGSTTTARSCSETRR